MNVADDGSVQFTIQPVAALKGDLPPVPVVVRLNASQSMRQHAKRLTHSDGAAYGLWFLGSAVEGATYELLPTEKGDYTEASGAYIPLPRFWTADPSQDRDQQLLSALAAGYYVSPPPSPLHDLSFFVSLENAKPEDARAVALDLMNSGAVGQQVVGVIAGLRLGLDESLTILSDRLAALRQHQRFDQITRALDTYYRPTGPQAMSGLRDLMEEHLGAPGLAAAVVKALQKFTTTPEILSIVALAFDSGDPSAIRAAANVFHAYTALAGPDGAINSSGDGQHPYWSEETRLYSGRKSIDPQEHASFWKAWWQENATKLSLLGKLRSR
jgi:hypothetical protein